MTFSLISLKQKRVGLKAWKNLVADKVLKSQCFLCCFYVSCAACILLYYMACSVFTRLIWYKTFGLKSSYEQFTSQSTTPTLLLSTVVLPHCVSCTARSACFTSSVQPDWFCAMCKCALVPGVSVAHYQPATGPLFILGIRLLLACGAKSKGRDSDCCADPTTCLLPLQI